MACDGDNALDLGDFDSSGAMDLNRVFMEATADVDDGFMSPHPSPPCCWQYPAREPDFIDLDTAIDDALTDAAFAASCFADADAVDDATGPPTPAWFVHNADAHVIRQLEVLWGVRPGGYLAHGHLCFRPGRRCCRGVRREL